MLLLVRMAHLHIEALPGLLVCIALQSGGCEEPRSPALTSEFAEIYTPADETVCRGDAEFIDSRIRHIAERLSAPLPNDLTIWVQTSPPDECLGDALGCYKPKDHAIFSHWDVLEHELGHAVATAAQRDTGPTLSPFWSEGIAEGLKGAAMRRNRPVLPEFSRGSPYEVHGPTAGHFVAWLGEVYGDRSLADVVAGLPEEDVFGVSLETLGEDYEREAPWFIPGIEYCSSEPLEADPHLSFQTNIRCNDPRTRSPLIAFTHSYTLIINEAADYELSTGPSTDIGLLRCATESLPTMPQSAGSETDVTAESEIYPNHTRFGPDAREVIHLEPGLYDIELAVLEEGTAEFELLMLQ